MPDIFNFGGKDDPPHHAGSEFAFPSASGRHNFNVSRAPPRVGSSPLPQAVFNIDDIEDDTAAQRSLSPSRSPFVLNDVLLAQVEMAEFVVANMKESLHDLQQPEPNSEDATLRQRILSIDNEAHQYSEDVSLLKRQLKEAQLSEKDAIKRLAGIISNIKTFQHNRSIRRQKFSEYQQQEHPERQVESTPALPDPKELQQQERPEQQVDNNPALPDPNMLQRQKPPGRQVEGNTALLDPETPQAFADQFQNLKRFLGSKTPPGYGMNKAADEQIDRLKQAGREVIEMLQSNDPALGALEKRAEEILKTKDPAINNLVKNFEALTALMTPQEKSKETSPGSGKKTGEDADRAIETPQKKSNETSPKSGKNKKKNKKKKQKKRTT